jgi:hypothetical protein
MSAILEAGDLTPDGLRKLLESVQPPDPEPRLWLEGPDGWALDWWRGITGQVSWCGAGRGPEQRSVAELLSRVWAGRLFAPSGELRWRVLPVLGKRCVRAVFLGSAAWGTAPALQSRPETLQGMQSRNEEALLWGQMTERTPNEWIELRIPHRFRYPVHATTPAGGRVGVKARLEVWEDGQGEPQFVRLCDLQAFTDRS